VPVSFYILIENSLNGYKSEQFSALSHCFQHIYERLTERELVWIVASERLTERRLVWIVAPKRLTERGLVWIVAT